MLAAIQTGPRAETSEKNDRLRALHLHLKKTEETRKAGPQIRDPPEALSCVTLRRLHAWPPRAKKAQLMSGVQIDRTLVRRRITPREPRYLSRLAFICIRRRAFRYRCGWPRRSRTRKARSAGRVAGHQSLSRRSLHRLRKARPHATETIFSITGKNISLMDDVSYPTNHPAALDALFDQEPARVQWPGLD